MFDTDQVQCAGMWWSETVVWVSRLDLRMKIEVVVLVLGICS